MSVEFGHIDCNDLLEKRMYGTRILTDKTDFSSFDKATPSANSLWLTQRHRLEKLPFKVCLCAEMRGEKATWLHPRSTMRGKLSCTQCRDLVGGQIRPHPFSPSKSAFYNIITLHSSPCILHFALPTSAGSY